MAFLFFNNKKMKTNIRKKRNGALAGSRTRVRERPLYRDYVRSRFVFLSCELKCRQDAHNPVRLISTFRYEQKLEPIPPYDANDTHAGLGANAAT